MELQPINRFLHKGWIKKCSKHGLHLTIGALELLPLIGSEATILPRITLNL
jgi:hypothetical protein